MFNVSALACNCSIAGAINAGECDDYTGQCSCKANVQSTKCDTCSEGHFNLQESNPDGCEGNFVYSIILLLACTCIACNCAAGSLSVQCDEIGICECIGDDVLGDKCDMCQVASNIFTLFTISLGRVLHVKQWLF